MPVAALDSCSGDSFACGVEDSAADPDPLADDEYSRGTFGVKSGDPAARALLDKMLPQTRFLSSTGTVIDLTQMVALKRSHR